jgi:hypothetical protein
VSVIRSFYNSCLVQKIAESHIYGETEKRNALFCACLTEIGVFTTQDTTYGTRYIRLSLRGLGGEENTEKRAQKEQ